MGLPDQTLPVSGNSQNEDFSIFQPRSGIYFYWFEMLLVYIVGASIVLLIFWITGTRTVKRNYELSSSDLSESEDMPEEQNSIEIIPSTNIDSMLDTDAVYMERRLQGTHPTLEIPDIRYIEEKLDDYEKTSLIFLLSDDPDYCINKVKISKWAIEQKVICPYWAEKFLEALAVIKNFQLPKKFGFSKERLVEEYFPFNQFFTKHICKFKKGLYFICENFKQMDEKLFIRELEEDFRMKKLSLPKFSQMEIYFSFLLKIGYLSPKNTDDCAKIVKKLDLEIAHDLFKTIEDKNKKDIIKNGTMNADCKKSVSRSSKNISSDKILGDEESISSVNSDSTQDNAPIMSKPSLRDPSPHGIYNKAGIKKCFIINQINFYTEVENEYKHLLPPNIEEEMLHPRSGTEVDLHRLKSVLERRNFEVTVKENLSHLRTITELQKMVESIDKETCSCFFVIILSHGDKGVVYCANSCYVKISTIIEKMSHKKLIHIPKVLILQTCQGPALQYVDDEDLTTDGNSSSGSDPKSPNFLVFSSTVPGFASIRHKKNGSWFIQALCDQIEEDADTKHFLDICTRVTNRVSTFKGKKDRKYYSMLSYTKTTFKKELYI